MEDNRLVQEAMSLLHPPITCAQADKAAQTVLIRHNVPSYSERAWDLKTQVMKIAKEATKSVAANVSDW
ncbi:MAG: uncharacterized protein KVP18_002673 [Porospora cf. gigantea A]|uniref:uncharacterized protein n=1 Tax=Porospora cf. gigantea A TaxID=2853593 RepID=UPI00355AA6A8|nr:MAG: hypothetical protein KVP18_002673 [Porospora cf. gigantea A]